MNTVTVIINGIEYNLRGKEDERYLSEVAAYVDNKIREISGSNKKLSTSSAAVLTAVNIADELFKCDLEIGNITKKKNSLEERHLTLKERLRELKVEIDEAAKARASEVEALKSVIFDMESKMKELEKYKVLSEDLTEKLKTLTEINNRVAISEFEEAITKLEKTQKINLILSDENDDLKERVSTYQNEANNYSIENSELKETEHKLRETIKFKEAELEEFKALNEQQSLEEKNTLEKKINSLEVELQDALKKKETYRLRNKDINFQLQNYKYKVLDLEKKLIDTQFSLAVEKRDKNPLLR